VSKINSSSDGQPQPCCPECHRRSGFTLGRDGKLVCPSCGTEFDPYSEQGDLNAPRRKHGLESDAVDPDGDEPGTFWCPGCGARTTRGTEGVEYGHRVGDGTNSDERCSRRPATVDSVDPRIAGAIAGHESREVGRFAAPEESEGEEGSA
jgi:hypothetical protein